MQVISNKSGEKFVLQQSSISVTVISVEGNVVKLGISAPPDIRVNRPELGREIHAEPANRG